MQRYGEKELVVDTEMYKKSSCKSDLNKIAKIILTNLTEVYRRFDKDIPKPYQRQIYFRNPIIDVCMKAVQILCF